jgi:hypothetical protein
MDNYYIDYKVISELNLNENASKILESDLTYYKDSFLHEGVQYHNYGITIDKNCERLKIIKESLIRSGILKSVRKD